MKYAKKYLDKKYLFPLLAGFLVFIVVRTFFIDIAVVRSASMQPALRPGQWVLIKKQFTVQRGHVVLISLPLSEKDTAQEKINVFKRVVGLPGDTVVVRAAQLYVNGVKFPRSEKFLHNYIAKIQRQADSVAFEQAGITDEYLVDDSCVYLVMLSNADMERLESRKKVFTLTSNQEDSALFDETVFPYDPNIKWNKDYFGPLHIPKKGDEVKLSVDNIKLYEKIITVYEGNALDVEKGKIYINEKEAYTYTIKNDYYFVTGDNFDNAIDSRHWGFIPAEKIQAETLREK